MSVTPGNDPFSGSNTRNILQHIISPKIVDTGSGAHSVKTDLINIDNAYTSSVYSTGIIRAGTGGAGDVQTSTAFAIYNPLTLATRGRITANNTDVWIQATQNINFGKISVASTNTSLELSDAGTNSDILQLGGSLDATGVIRGSNLQRQTQSDVVYTTGYYTFDSTPIDPTVPAMYSFLMYSPTGIALEGKIVVGDTLFEIVSGSYLGTVDSPVYSATGTPPQIYIRQSFDYSTTFSIIVQQLC